MLSIGIEFLARRYYAQDPHSAQLHAEWPPHPDRLFSALVSAAYARTAEPTLDPAERAALLWLEGLPAPIWSGPVMLGSGRFMQSFVPTNAVDLRAAGGNRLIQLEALPEFRSRQPRSFASIAVDTPGYWTWPDAEMGEHAVAMKRLVEGVARLGASPSFVRLWLESQPPAATLIPAPTSAENSVAVRVPHIGRLQSLEHAFAVNRRPGFSIPITYAPPNAVVPAKQVAVSPWAFTYFLKFDHPVRDDIAQGLVWTEALRRAVLSRAGELGDIPQALHGHAKLGHCAFVAVPDVGYTHSDGHLIGVAVLLPSNLTTRDREAIYPVLARVNHVVVRGQAIGLTPITSLPSNRVPVGLRSERWSGSGEGTIDWVSVTPVVFDRFPKNRRKILPVIQTMAQWAGLPEVLDAQLIHGTSIAGGVFAQDFMTERRPSATPHFVSHMSVLFAQPVHGPILMGQLRNFGLGLFIPVARKEADHEDDQHRSHGI
ncbi:MAG: type I-G CRISPR-associated protein Csb2 [Sulfobacillus sp.]